MKNYRIAIFASGNGSNALQIYSFFHQKDNFHIVGIYTNNPKAGIVEKGRVLEIPVFILSEELLQNGQLLTRKLVDDQVDVVILAGYLKKIPIELVQQYPKTIINIHPALLPKHGGKGMYGMNVHKAVKAAQDTESGITIHLVNENYDEGKQLAQFTCSVESGDTPEDIQQKVQKLEHLYFAPTIFDYINLI